MGMAGPLICYQVESSVKTTAKSDFGQLRSVATILDKNPPQGVNYSQDYPENAPRYAHRDKSGTIPIHVEKNDLMRPTLLRLLQTVSPEFMGILVPDIDDFLDCDPYLAATLARMNLSFGMQILSLRVRVKGQLVDKVALDPERLLLSSQRGRPLDELMWANSMVCQKKSEVKLSRLANDDNPEICRLKDMDMSDAGNENLLALLRAHDEGFDVSQSEARDFAPADLARTRRYGR